MDTPQMNVPLSRYAANKIVDYITQQGLHGGDKLPNETQLCEITGVSRGTIREAVKILNTENIVTIQRGVGTFVSDHPGISEDPLGFRFIEDKEKLVFDLIQIREILEPSLASIAAENATDEEILHLSEIATKLEEYYAQGKDTVPLDIEFHSQIARMSHNRVVELIYPILAKSIPEITEYTNKALLSESMVDHQQIWLQIKNHNSFAAEAFMKTHLKRNKEYIENQQRC